MKGGRLAATHRRTRDAGCGQMASDMTRLCPFAPGELRLNRSGEIRRFRSWTPYTSVQPCKSCAYKRSMSSISTIPHGNLFATCAKKHSQICNVKTANALWLIVQCTQRRRNDWTSLLAARSRHRETCRGVSAIRVEASFNVCASQTLSEEDHSPRRDSRRFDTAEAVPHRGGAAGEQHPHIAHAPIIAVERNARQLKPVI